MAFMIKSITHEDFMRKKTMQKLAALSTLLLCMGNIHPIWANSLDKAKEYVDNASDSLKRALDTFARNLEEAQTKLGKDAEAIQNYLNHYNWRGIIQDEANSANTTLKHMSLNGHSRAVVVKPGERVNGVVQCVIDREKSSALSLYRVVLGIHGKGPQTTIGNEFGLTAGESLENFVLIAPSQPGIYQIRFRVVDSYLVTNALESWTDEKGNEPNASTTMGILIVKS